jgi:hypothetical protein
VAALDGDREGSGQDPVLAEHGGGGVAGVEQGRVELVEVFRPQAIDPVTSIPGIRCFRTADW